MIYSFGETDNLDYGDKFTAILPDFRSEAQQRHTALAIHDATNNDLLHARKLVEEIINISGAEIKLYVRTDNSDYDRVWDSDPDPTYWQAETIKAYFKPQPIEADLEKWGLDVKNKIEIVFSHYQIYTKFGDRMLRAGDVVTVPYNAANAKISPSNYRIENVTPSGNFRYNWLYLSCMAVTLTSDITVRPLDQPPLPVTNTIEDEFYRESI